MNVAAEHPDGQPFIAAFREALQLLGWSDGRTPSLLGLLHPHVKRPCNG
jgi:hypothetical protein